MNKEYINRLIREYNPDLGGKRFPTPEFKRDLYENILRWMKKKQAIAIVGLRRTGKTTLMRQIMENVEGPSAYFSFDEEETQNKEILVYVIDYMLGNLGSEFIFLDEIQYVKEWEGVVKRYYDQKGIKFILSGSESLHISSARESLAGRLLILELKPLNFREFLTLREPTNTKFDRQIDGTFDLRDISLSDFTILEELYNKFLTKKESFEQEFEEYIYKGAFPELVNENDREIIRDYIEGLVLKKIVYRDIPSIFQVKRRNLLYGLLEYACNYSSTLYHTKTLAETLGANVETIGNYLFYLQHAFLVKTAESYSGSPAKRVRRNKKLYVTAPCMAIALLGYSREMLIESLMGHYVETVFAGDFFYRDKQKTEVDVVLNDDSLLPIEIKYQKMIFSSDLKGVLIFMDKFKLKKGLVITRDTMERRRINGKEIMLIPAWLALMVYR